MKTFFFPGVYSAGWLSTGPVGVILSTMSSAFETGASVVDDIQSQVIDVMENKQGFSAINTKLNAKGMLFYLNVNPNF